jgi:hypothetical protein
VKRIQHGTLATFFAFTPTAVMEQVKEKIRVDALLAVASRLNSDLPCTASPALNGGMHIVVPIVFTDGTMWCARMPYDKSGDSDSRGMESIARLMLFLEECLPEIPSPRLKKFCLDEVSTIGVPCMLLTWLHGRTLAQLWFPGMPLTPQRENLLRQLARLQFDMTFQSRLLLPEAKRRQVPDKESRGLASDWILRVHGRRIVQALTGTSHAPSSDHDIYARFLIRARILEGEYIAPALNTTDFSLHHDDLNCNNLLVDDEWNIVG